MADHAAEHLERPLPDLFVALSAEHPHALLRAVRRQFGEQSGLAVSRFAFDERQRASPCLRPPDLFIQFLQFSTASHESRFGQRGPVVVRADHTRRLVYARGQCLADIR